MRKTIPLVLVGALAIAGCQQDSSSPTGSNVPDPSFGEFPESDPRVDLIEQLLDDLLDGRDYERAHALFSVLKTSVLSGEEDQIDGHLANVFDFIVERFVEGDVNDPAGGRPAGEVGAELVNRLFEFAGRGNPNFDGSIFGSDDIAARVVGGGGGNVVTKSGFGGVVIPPSAVGAPTIVTVRRLDREECLPFDLPQYDACFEFERFPDGEFDVPVLIGQCIDLRALDFPQDTLVLLHKYEPESPEQGIRALPRADPGFIDCEGFFDVDFGSAAPSGLIQYANAGLNLLRRGAAALLSPEPLMATAMADGPRRLGGLSSSFTDLTAALPASMSALEGDDQVGSAGAAAPVNPAVIVRDPNGDPVAGATVHWEVTHGDGAVTPLSVVTGDDGTARGW